MQRNDELELDERTYLIKNDIKTGIVVNLDYDQNFFERMSFGSTIPIDAIKEILYWLPLKDLVHLTATSKGVRSTFAEIDANARLLELADEFKESQPSCLSACFATCLGNVFIGTTGLIISGVIGAGVFVGVASGIAIAAGASANAIGSAASISGVVGLLGGAGAFTYTSSDKFSLFSDQNRVHVNSLAEKRNGIEQELQTPYSKLTLQSI